MIVIDDLLTVGNHYIANKYKDTQQAVFTFSDFSSANKQHVFNLLEALKVHNGAAVVHVSLEGMRGVNLKMNGVPRVLLGFVPTDPADIRQALGRGTRQMG